MRTHTASRIITRANIGLFYSIYEIWIRSSNPARRREALKCKARWLIETDRRSKSEL